MKIYNITYLILGLFLAIAGLFFDLYLQILNWMVILSIICGGALIGGLFSQSAKNSQIEIFSMVHADVVINMLRWMK